VTRILILSIYHDPEPIPKTGELARELRRRGHDAEHAGQDDCDGKAAKDYWKAIGNHVNSRMAAAGGTAPACSDPAHL